MAPSYRKSGIDFLPVILHSTGKKEVLYGDKLATIQTAKKYAQIEINRRLK